MEQIAIEMMGLAMVAQIQAHHLVATIKHQLRQRQDVQRLRAALPAVHYDDRPSRTANRTGPETLQAHAITASEKHLLLGRDHAGRTLQDGAPARSGARQHRLHVAVAEPSRWPEIFVRSEQHGAKAANPSESP